MLANRGRYLEAFGDRPGAQRDYLQALAWDQGSVAAAQGLARVRAPAPSPTPSAP